MTGSHTDVDEFARLRDEEDGRTIAEMKADDTYEDGTVTEAKLNSDGTSWAIGWEGELGGSYGCGCPANREAVPIIAAGDKIRIYSPHGFGSTFHGIDINGVEMFWRTPWERFAKRVQWLANDDREQRERFVKEKATQDERFEQLSEPMKARITRFREAEPDFRIKSEAYEMFACWQADVFAARAREAAASGEAGQDEVLKWFDDGSFAREHPGQAERPAKDLTPAVRWLLWWSKLPYDRQKELMPGMDEGHSGNTFGSAWYFAVRLLLEEEV